MKKLLLATVVFLQVACGVKGDPLPPIKPTNLGRGKPTYDRATKDIGLDRLPKEDPLQADTEDESEEEEE